MTNTLYTTDNSKYIHDNPSWHTEDSPWKASQVFKLLQKNNINPRSIAEIGCGAGEILNQLYNKYDKQSVTFSGFEIAPDAIKLCESRAKPGLSFYQQDLLQTSLYFDVLLMMDVFEHVDDYLGFIRKSRDKAAFKVFHIPLDLSVSSILRGKLMDVRNKVGHLHYFMKDTALATLRDSGMEVLDYFYTKGSIELNNDSHTFKTRLANIPRKLIYSFSPDLAVKLLGGYSIIVLTK